MARTRQVAAPKSYAEVESDDDASYMPDSAAPSRTTSKKRKSDSVAAEPLTINQAHTTTNPAQGVEVKTKFPVARIKRIMQADEDVGKVAQATPTAVCMLHSFSPSILFISTS
jgi:Dr1-associated corepressor